MSDVNTNSTGLQSERYSFLILQRRRIRPKQFNALKYPKAQMLSFSVILRVPIPLMTVSVNVNDVIYERQQLPLTLSWVLTIHKS